LVGLVEYERIWEAELERRKFFDKKPTALAVYEMILKCPDLLTAGAEKIVAVNSENLRVLASAEYAVALVHLKKYISANEGMKVLLDRDALGAVGQINQVPRLVTSRSVHKRTYGASAKVSNEDIKHTILLTVLW